MEKQSNGSQSFILSNANKETPITLELKSNTINLNKIDANQHLNLDNEKSQADLEATASNVKKAKPLGFLIDIFDPISATDDDDDDEEENSQEERRKSNHYDLTEINTTHQLPNVTANSLSQDNEEDKTTLDSNIVLTSSSPFSKAQIENEKNLQLFKNSNTSLTIPEEANNELAMIKSLPSSSLSSPFVSSSYQTREENLLDTDTDKQETYTCFNSRNKRRPLEFDEELFTNENNEKKYSNEANSRKKNKLNLIADGLLMKKENSFVETTNRISDMDQPILNSVNLTSNRIDSEIEDLFSTSALANLATNTTTTPTEENSNFTTTISNSFYQPSIVVSTTSGSTKASPTKTLQTVKSHTSVFDSHADSFSMKLAYSFSSNSTEQNKIFVETVSENVNNFLKFTQDELLGKNICSLIGPNEYTKFTNVFSNIINNNTGMNQSLKQANANKFKPFPCQMLIKNTNNSACSTIDVDSNNNTFSQQYESMIASPVFPKNISNSSKFDPNLNNSIIFTFKTNKPPFKITSPTSLLTVTTGCPVSSSLVSPSSSLSPSAQISPYSNYPASAYDSISVKFQTKMTLKGKILWADSANLKNSFNFVAKGGLLFDAENEKNVNIIEYVHNNDLNHIQKHLSDAVNKTENTSAIYRLKVSEKYAFVQTNSKLIPNENYDEKLFSDTIENDKKIILSCHSIIKEIDTEVEMKGNASTSLMKTLISKKPTNGIASNTSSLLVSKNQSHTPTGTPISPTSTNNSEAITSMSPTSKLSQKQLVKNTNLEPLNVVQYPNSDSLLSISVNSGQASSPSSNSPIGTKFALTMLGLTNNTNKSDQNLFQRTQRDNSSKCVTQEDGSSDNLSQVIKNGLRKLSTNSNLSNKSPLSPIDMSSSPILEKQPNIFSDINNNNSSIDNSFEYDTTNSLFKRSISENTHMSIVLLDKSKEKELKETLQAAFSSSSSSIASPFSPKSSHNRFKQKSNNKDDIILRALLKTSDLEPQLLKLESVFDMNKAKKSPLSRHNSEVNETSSVSLNASTNILKVSDEDINHKSKNLKNGLSSTKKTPKSKKLSSSSLSNDQNSEFLNNSQVKGVGRKNKKREELNIKLEPSELSVNPFPKYSSSSKKRTASINELNSNTDDLVKFKHIKKEKQEIEMSTSSPFVNNRKHVSQEDVKLENHHQNNFNPQKAAIMTGREKLSSSSSASSASTLSPINCNVSFTNLKTPLTSLNATTTSSNQIISPSNSAKNKNKVTPSSCNMSLTEDEDMINQLEQVFSTQNSNFNELETEFDLNENVSTLSKNIAKNYQPIELDKFQNNNLINSSSPSYTISSIKTNDTNHNSEQRLNLLQNNLNPYQQFSNSPIHNSDSPLITNILHKSFNELNENFTNTKQLASASNISLNSSQKTVSIAPFNSSTNNLPKSTNNSGIEFPTTKQDEDITKQKRIEHITKLLKTDLIESFKSVSQSTSPNKNASPNYKSNSNTKPNDNDPTELILSPYSNTSIYQNQLTPTNIQHQHYQQQYSNPNSNLNYQALSSSEQDENFLINDLNLSATGLDQDNNVPNLTIEPNSLPSPFQQQQQQQKLQLQNNRQRSSSSLTMSNYVQKLDDMPNDDFLAIQQQCVNRRNSINAISFSNQVLNNQNNFNDQSNVRKKLQERLQQRNTGVTGMTISSNAIPSQPSHVMNSNVAVVSPVVSTHNQNTTNYPPNYQQDMLSSKNSMATETGPIYQQNLPTSTSKISPTQVQHHQKSINNGTKFNTSLPPPPPPLPPPSLPPQQQHLATTTTTVTVTTQHYPLPDQTISNPPSLSTQISMHSLSPSSLINQNQIYPATPPSYNYSTNSMIQKNFLNQPSLQHTTPTQLPSTSPQIGTSHQSILINSNPNYGINNPYINQPNSNPQSQFYDVNGNNSVFYPSQSINSNSGSGVVGVGPPNRYKNNNDEPEHISINRNLGKQRSTESKKNSNKRLQGLNSSSNRDIYNMSPSSSSSPIGNAGIISQNSHQAQNPSQFNQPQPPPSIHIGHHQQGPQLNSNLHHYPEYYNNNMPANFNYPNQQNLSTKYQHPPLPPTTLNSQQHQNQLQPQKMTGINRQQAAMMSTDQYNITNELINSSETLLFDDVLDLNFAPNDPIITSSSTTPAGASSASNTTVGSTVIEDDSFLNFSFPQRIETITNATNINNNAQSQNMPPINSNPNQNYFQSQYQNQTANNIVSYQQAPPPPTPQQLQLFYNQTATSQSIYQQHQQINTNFQHLPNNNNNNSNYNNNSGFDLIVEDSKGGLLQQLLLD